MDVPELPASVVVRMADGDTLRGTLVEERTDGWLLDEESGRLILVYPQDIEQIERRNESGERSQLNGWCVEKRISRTPISVFSDPAQMSRSSSDAQHEKCVNYKDYVDCV